MPVHANSIEAHRTNRYGERHRAILGTYQRSDMPMTDREIKDSLGLADMNSVRPRINELIECGAVVEMTPGRCQVTGKTVRRCMATGAQLPGSRPILADPLDLFAGTVKPDYSQWGERNG